MIGMNEVGLNAKWLCKDLTHVETQDFAKEVLNHMRDRLVMYQEEYGDLYNLEATPAESTTYRMAKHDKEQYPGDTPYYTNSSHLPVSYTADIFDALDIQDGLQTLYTSGTVFHAFLGEKLPGWKAAAALVRKIAENYSLPYYTLSPTSAKNMDTLQVSILPARSAEKNPKYTAVSQDTTVRSRTGMMARHRSTRTVNCMM